MPGSKDFLCSFIQQMFMSAHYGLSSVVMSGFTRVTSQTQSLTARSDPELTYHQDGEFSYLDGSLTQE